MRKLPYGRTLAARRVSAAPFRSLLTVTAALLSLGGALLLTGCGSGGSGGDPDPTPTPTPTPTANVPRYVTAGFDIVWAVRSREVTSPDIPTLASASSVRVTLRGAGQDGGDVSIVVNRPSDRAAGYSEPVDFPRPVRVADSQTLDVEFYTGANRTGSLVGEGSATVSILADGSGIGALSTSSRIARTKILPNQSALVGEDIEIDFEVRDIGGALIPVPRGAAFFTIAPADTARLSIVGGTRAQGKRPGSANVTVSVDGVVSDLENITVRSNTVVAVSPSVATLNALSEQRFTARVSNAPETGVVWSVREGADGGSVSTDGVYKAPDRRGVFHVEAVSVYDGAKIAAATVTVSPFMTASPASATITLRQQQAFTASVVGLTDTGVVWSVLEGSTGGTVTGDGFYTAPDLPGTYHLVAASREDASIQTTVPIIVQAGSGTVIIE